MDTIESKRVWVKKIVDESVDPWLAKNTLSTTSKCQSYIQTSKRDWRHKKTTEHSTKKRQNLCEEILSIERWKDFSSLVTVRGMEQTSLYYFLIITIFYMRLLDLHSIHFSTSDSFKVRLTLGHTQTHTHIHRTSVLWISIKNQMCLIYKHCLYHVNFVVN